MSDRIIIREALNLIEDNNQNNDNDTIKIYTNLVRDVITLIDNELIPKFEEEMENIKTYLKGRGEKIDDKNLDRLEKQGTSENLRQIRRTYRDAIAFKDHKDYVTDDMDKNTAVIFLYKGARILREANNKLALDDELSKRVSKKATELKRQLKDTSKNMSNDDLNRLIKTARSKRYPFPSKIEYSKNTGNIKVGEFIDKTEYYCSKYDHIFLDERMIEEGTSKIIKDTFDNLVKKIMPKHKASDYLSNTEQKEIERLLDKYGFRSMDSFIHSVNSKINIDELSERDKFLLLENFDSLDEESQDFILNPNNTSPIIRDEIQDYEQLFEYMDRIDNIWGALNEVKYYYNNGYINIDEQRDNDYNRFAMRVLIKLIANIRNISTQFLTMNVLDNNTINSIKSDLPDIKSLFKEVSQFSEENDIPLNPKPKTVKVDKPVKKGSFLHFRS